MGLMLLINNLLYQQLVSILGIRVTREQFLLSICELTFHKFHKQHEVRSKTYMTQILATKSPLMYTLEL
jgi:hypothetical protein